MLDIRDKVETSKRQKVDISRQRYNFIFQGNPEPERPRLDEYTQRAKLASAGPANAFKLIAGLVNDGGGVNFVDETYQLVADHAGPFGGAVLDILLTEMENKIGKLAVIFAGYKKEMEAFFEHNPGLSSRVPYILNFEDMDDVSLWTIMSDLIAQRYHGRMNVKLGMCGLYMRILIRRLGRGRGIHRWARRLKKEKKKDKVKLENSESEPDIFLFTKENLIGPKSEEAFKSEAWLQLKSMIGLDEVKVAARCMIDMITTNYYRELAELNPFKCSLNQVFCGAPGTGKMTVATLYGHILADIGLLSSGEMIVKNPYDFIGQCLGKSEAKTQAILRASLEKFSSLMKLTSEVQGVPGDNRCVLFLGYEERIMAMFQAVNPGLARRFAIENRFRFQDYTVSQLMNILNLKVSQQHLKPTTSALAVAEMTFVREKMRPNFSNGGDVDNLLQKSHSTGKSTTARLMGEIYYDLGFLATTDVIDCKATDLIGRYVGHTAPQTQALMKSAFGKVLFVDEAYRLLEGQYAIEVVNELITFLGSPEYARQMVVILAGYPRMQPISSVWLVQWKMWQ
ncbi:hypothetical protein EX30DRAFT_371621 [Ascodesmis nigricans]|uniref:ATPase AAA-type core domain-containing protein n=1 Tax=Ascodesmis nigricans TaxID=341454 RepID=A0A4S2MXA6_9PEZI|nr:hypothetical protein EX30DRAFT_371621 [Ascodesmis nigricans]